MPCDYSRYPANWIEEIRPNILDRANHCCEKCGVRNYSVGWRDYGGDFWLHEDADSYGAAKALIPKYATANAHKPIIIVLTVAHIYDPNPMNCDDDNLMALCQRCHNRHDAAMRAENAAKTRQRQRDELTGQMDLFEEVAA